MNQSFCQGQGVPLAGQILHFVHPQSLMPWKFVFLQVSMLAWGSGRESEKSPETGTLVTTRAWTLDVAEPMHRGRDKAIGNRTGNLEPPSSRTSPP